MRTVAMWLVALAMVVGACSSDDGPDIDLVDNDTTTTSTTTTAEATTTTTADPEDALRAEIEEAYLDYWDAYLEIFADPDPDDPLIEQTYTGDALETARETTAALRDETIRVRPPENPDDFRIEILSINVGDETGATVLACVVDGLVQVAGNDATVINDQLRTIRAESQMRREDGRWKSARITYEDIGEGAQPCD